jgi:hypothetical protein
MPKPTRVVQGPCPPKATRDWDRQRVHEGYTRAGTRGLFTGNYLACTLREGEDARDVARRMGFIFEEV